MKEGHPFAKFVESKLDKLLGAKDGNAIGNGIGHSVRHYDLSELSLDPGNARLYLSFIMIDSGEGLLEDKQKERLKELLFEDEGKGGIVMEDSEEVSFIDQNDETILIISSIQ